MGFEEPNKGWVENETALPERNKFSTILELQGKEQRIIRGSYIVYTSNIQVINTSFFSKRFWILRRNNPSWLSISEKTWHLQQTSVVGYHYGLLQCGRLFWDIEHSGLFKCQNISFTVIIVFSKNILARSDDVHLRYHRAFRWCDISFSYNLQCEPGKQSMESVWNLTFISKRWSRVYWRKPLSPHLNIRNIWSTISFSDQTNPPSQITGTRLWKVSN